MAEPFLGEIRIASFSFAPKGWALCNGQLLPINQNQGLFSLLGTTFGGDGRVNFALPDFRGRMPIHVAPGYPRGTRGGAEEHTLSINEMPAHTHVPSATSAVGHATGPTGNAFAASRGNYAAAATAATRTDAITSVGGSQSHLNLPPFITLNFVIALQGIFPSQN
ncbi:tail fiber protein [Pulveribacter sp.]|uniref:phage tail protein n=1 Tax=Pulveribacter sp. TaxID=2678893 RepID=UPI00289BB7A1|nr:tail fiber protein [Pulveribacter sp.]